MKLKYYMHKKWKQIGVSNFNIYCNKGFQQKGRRSTLQKCKLLRKNYFVVTTHSIVIKYYN